MALNLSTLGIQEEWMGCAGSGQTQEPLPHDRLQRSPSAEPTLAGMLGQRSLPC